MKKEREFKFIGQNETKRKNDDNDDDEEEEGPSQTLFHQFLKQDSI